MNTADAYFIAAQWHDKNARQCAEIAADDPRIDAKIRERAELAAAHHRASSAGLRFAASDLIRKDIERPSRILTRKPTSPPKVKQ